MTQIKLYNGNRYEEFDNVLQAHNTGMPYMPKKYGPGNLFFTNYMYFTDLLNVESYDPLAIGAAIYLGLQMQSKFNTMFSYNNNANRMAKTMALVAQGSDRRYIQVPRIFFAYYETDTILADRLDNVPAPDNKYKEIERQVIDFIYAAVLSAKRKVDEYSSCRYNSCNSLIRDTALLMKSDKLDHVFEPDIGLVGHCVRNQEVRVEVTRIAFSVMHLTVRQILCHIFGDITFYGIVPMIAYHDFASILVADMPVITKRPVARIDRYGLHVDRKVLICNHAYKKYNMTSGPSFSDITMITVMAGNE